MVKRTGIVVAAVAMAAIIIAGTAVYACGGKCGGGQFKGIQSARAPMTAACCPGGQAACAEMSSGCKGMKGASAASCAGMAAKAASAESPKCGEKMSASGCGSKAATAGGGCGGCKGAAKAFYSANVYQVTDGKKFAVAEGKTFEITDDTPYYEAGRARYYFPDKECLTSCSDKMSTMIPAIDRQAVALVKVDGNVTVDKYGKRYAMCPTHRQKFLVTADSPARVIDGARYYACSEECWQKFMAAATQPEANTKD